MTISSRSLIALVVVALAGCKSSNATSGSDDARRAVDEFYAWYVPMQHGTNNAAMLAVRERPTLFTADLIAALRADSVASAASPGEVVGLDGDPFLNSQDPCQRYASNGVVDAGGHFLVQVLGTGGCASHTNADVTVEVTPVKGGFVFTNFIYSSRDKDNLSALLADLAASRHAKPK